SFLLVSKTKDPHDAFIAKQYLTDHAAFTAMDWCWTKDFAMVSSAEIIGSSENRPPMLNKENYVPWSSRLLRYAKSDQNHEVPVNETFHEQTDDELTEKELKQVEADDQAIQTILLSLLEDIYDAVDKKNAKLFNERKRFTSTDRESIESYYHHFSKLMNDFKRNKHLPENIARNQNGINAVQNVENQVVQNAVQNLEVQNVGNQNGLNVVPRITNQNQNRNGNVVAARAEGNATGNNDNQIRCYNCRGLGHFARNYGSAKVHNYDNCYDNEIFSMFTQEEQYTELLDPILEPHQVLQNDNNVIFEVSSMEQDGRTIDLHPATVEKTHAYFESLYNNLSIEVKKALELEIERLLRAIVSQDIMSVVQNNSVEDTSNLQTELERTKECFENCIIKKENEYAKLWNENENVELEFRVLNYAKENAHLKTTYKNLFDFIFVTRTQTKTIIDSLQNRLHDTIYENAKLRAQLFDQVFKQKDTTKGTSVNTQFCKQSILGKPPSSSKLKLYAVTPFPKSKGLFKINETHALSKPVTSNSIPTSQEPKVVKNDKVIAPGMFRINPFKPFREEKYVPNKVRASVRTNPITVSQPHVITKKDVNYDSIGSSSIRVYNIAKTRRPQPRSNTKNDRVPSESKSSCSKNKEVEVEEHPRNLSLSKNKTHMSSKCNNVKLAIWNDKLAVVCAICKQCLITANHDVCVLNYVNDMNSHEYFDSVGISHQASSVRTPQQNGVVERRNWTLVEVARTMFIFSHAPLFLWAEAIAIGCYTQNRSIIHRRFNKTPYELINGRNPNISFLHVFGALCYPKNDHEDIGKLGAKGDIGFFIGYSVDSCAYRVYNQRTNKIIETMNVTFDELSAMAFEQSSSKPELQSMTSGQISSGLDLTYAPSIITTQQPTKGELDLLFEAMYDDYIGGQPSAAPITVLAAQAP
nr:retrovirus-related Pol polyprotein from transposon TNT 1-94 [Tanacetum cinerariifolium]